MLRDGYSNKIYKHPKETEEKEEKRRLRNFVEDHLKVLVTKNPLCISAFDGDNFFKQYENVAKGVCDAYGNILYDNIPRTSKYVKACPNEDVGKHIYDIITEIWRFKKPKLIITINCGLEESTHLNKKQQAEFKLSLMNVAKHTRTWIITSGFNFGVSKMIGEAAHGIVSSKKSAKRYKVIGIVNWASVCQNEVLKVKEDGKDSTYKISKHRQVGDMFELDPNHDAFVFLDCDKCDEISFGAYLEKQMSTAAQCPVIQVVAGCSERSIEVLNSSLANDFPVVVVDDFLRFETQFEKDSKKEASSSGDEYSWKYEKNKLDNEFMKILKDEKTKKLIFEVRSGDTKKYFGQVLLQALTRPYTKNGTEDKEKVVSVVKDAQNRTEDKEKLVSVVKDNSEKKENQENHENKMMALILTYNRSYGGLEPFVMHYMEACKIEDSTIKKALKKNQWQFVEQFLVNDMKLEPCLKEEGLLKIYDKEKVKRLSRYYLASDEDDASQIRTIIKKLAKNIIKYRDRSQTYNQTEYKDLFLWSLITEKWEMAEILWQNGEDQISSALIASIICKSLAKLSMKEGDNISTKELQDQQVRFENMADKVLTEAFRLDKSMAHILIVRKLPHLNDMTCMAIAVKCNLYTFLSNGACQNSLNKIWFGDIYNLTSMSRLLLNLPLALCTSKNVVFSRANCAKCCSADEEDRESEPEIFEDVQKKAVEKHNGCIKNFCYFRKVYKKMSYTKDDVKLCRAVGYYFCAPKTKYIMAVISYFAFLAIFSYVCLVELKPNVAALSNYERKMEYALYAFILSFILEEFRKITENRAKYFRNRFNEWVTTRWNLFNVLLYILFGIAVVLRHIESIEFFYARTMFSVTCAMYYLRFLQFYYADKSIGPKVISVYKMLKDVFFFLSIYMLALFAYGILAQSLLYSNSIFDFYLLKNIVYMPYWQIYGDLHLEYIEGLESQGNVTATPNAIVIAGFALYMLFITTILMNLLIAMFQRTLNRDEKNSYNIWTLIRYKLFDEFYMRPVMPPPLNIFEIIVSTFRGLNRLCQECSRKEVDKKEAHKMKKKAKKLKKENTENYIKNDKKKRKEKNRIFDEFSLHLCDEANRDCRLFERFCLDEYMVNLGKVDKDEYYFIKNDPVSRSTQTTSA